MKTSWDINYLNARFKNYNAWGHVKRRELERKHGVPFTVCTAHGKLCFRPTWDKTTEAIDDPVVAQRLLDIAAWARNSFLAVTFVEAHERTGISLREIVGNALYLARTRKICPVVDRMGRAIAFYQGSRYKEN